jgi:hypothetical protein
VLTNLRLLAFITLLLSSRGCSSSKSTISTECEPWLRRFYVEATQSMQTDVKNPNRDVARASTRQLCLTPCSTERSEGIKLPIRHNLFFKLSRNWAIDLGASPPFLSPMYVDWMIYMPNDDTNRLEPNFPDLSTVNADRLWMRRCSFFFLHISLIALDLVLQGIHGSSCRRPC